MVRSLGQGGMGLVLHVQDADGRDLALKLLTVENATAASLERFQREGQVTAALRHPGIVAVHAAGEVDGWPCIAYELVEGGQTLADALPQRTPRESAQLLLQTAAAVAHAHAHGVLHRDLKLENVLVDPAGRVRVADFGLAQATHLERLTLTGAMVGTPGSMSPEQIGGARDQFGPPTDVWALGVMLYQALTGQDPFQARTLAELAIQIVDLEPTAPRALDPAIEPGLEAVCLQALRKEPAERYADAGAFAADLRLALQGKAPRALHARRRGAWSWGTGYVAAGIALLVGASLAASRWRSAPAVVEAPPTLTREQLREAARAERDLERLAECLARHVEDPSSTAIELRRLDAETYRALPAANERLLEVQAQTSAALRRAIEAPDLRRATKLMQLLQAARRLLPASAVPFPDAEALSNQLARTLTSVAAQDFDATELFAAWIETGARITDREAGASLAQLTMIAMDPSLERVNRGQAELLLTMLARLDVPFGMGVRTDYLASAAPLAPPRGREVWPSYLRLRLTRLEEHQSPARSRELQALLEQPGLDLGPVHRAEALAIVAHGLPPAERLPVLARAAEAYPLHTVVPYLQAEALFALERFDDAVEACERTRRTFEAVHIAANPLFANDVQDVHELLIRALAGAGRREEARREYQVLARDPAAHDHVDPLRASLPWLAE